MADAGSAPDTNDPSWDPSRDSALERQSLLRELDPVSAEQSWAAFIPEKRTRSGLPLSHRASELLLGSTAEDLETIANVANLAADVDDDDQAGALLAATDAYEALLGRHRRLRRDSDERTLAGMPVGDRREARRLQNLIRDLQATRYDMAVLRRRELTAAIRRLEDRAAEARARDNSVQAAEYERLLALQRRALSTLR